MIEVALWQLVLFVLAGVALGAVIMMVRVAKGRPTQDTASTKPIPSASLPAAPPTTVNPAQVAEALSVAERRKGIIKDFLNKRIMSGRNITIDEAAKCLSVSPRRISRLLNTNTLVAIPISGGGRRVSAVSVLDLIARREAVASQEVKTSREPAQRAAELVREIVEMGEGSTVTPPKEPTEVEPANADKPEPNPNQRYWYFVAGYDKPCHDIKEALAVMGMEYRFTSWRTIPAHIRRKLTREKIE